MNPPIEMQCLVDSHDRPFLIIDREFRILAVNEAFECTYRLKREDVVGRACFDVGHHSDRPCYEHGEDCPYFQVYRTGQPHTCLHTHYDGEGQPRWVRVSVTPLRGSDGSLYLGEMLQEIGASQEGAPPEDEEGRPVGQSAAFLHVMEQLELAAHAGAPVLLVGETGTGKELAANFIHRHSERRGKPFLALDCTVITEPLFESEVFGHERGAFTGNVGARKGLFELAGGGTLFLDEIGEMPLAMQAKLLRVLETGEFRRVGGNATLSADVRIVCATNRHLWESVKAGQFREDLYYRIACFCIRMPALRERLDDIPVLAESLLSKIAHATGRSYRLAPGAVRYLQRYEFPGNIRELRNILRVAAAHSSHGPITREQIERCVHMKQELMGSTSPNIAGTPSPKISRGHRSRALGPVDGPEAAQPGAVVSAHDTTLESLEARHIAELLSRFRGHRRKVAVALGISERTLYRKLHRYGLS